MCPHRVQFAHGHGHGRFAIHVDRQHAAAGGADDRRHRRPPPPLVQHRRQVAGSTPRMTRFADSLNSVACATGTPAGPVTPAPRRSAPIGMSPNAHSASATASPPSEQSCADAAAAPTSSAAAHAGRARASGRGSGRPRTWPWISCRYSSRQFGAVSPSSTISQTVRGEGLADHRRASSISPTMPITGVG